MIAKISIAKYINIKVQVLPLISSDWWELGTVESQGKETTFSKTGSLTLILKYVFIFQHYQEKIIPYFTDV